MDVNYFWLLLVVFLSAFGVPLEAAGVVDASQKIGLLTSISPVYKHFQLQIFI